MKQRPKVPDGYSDMFSCCGKVAVVTGGCGLIGKEICRALSDFGAKVYVADLKYREAGSIADKISGGRLLFDICNENSIRRGFNRVVKESGSLDILVNCAYPRTKDWGKKAEEVPLSSWKKNCNDHMGGYFASSRAAASIMKKQRSGAIINFASIYGIAAPDFTIYDGTSMTMPIAYSAIKGGIISFTRYMASYYAKYNIRANVISPGGLFDSQAPSFVKRYTAKVPLGRMACPADITGAVVFLSSGASSYMTGCNVVVDGGWSI
jgi:NAD(P)-dependent dehydrogenase (short-subunit alcohol dehydrogenase family)